LPPRKGSARAREEQKKTMTIIELNIVGLHLTRTAPDFTRDALSRSWRKLVGSVGHAHWPSAHFGSRDAVHPPAA
jgi:hypothetical protein